MTIESVYQCDICKMRYDTEKEALDCEARGKPSPPQYKIGDEVFCHQKYSDKFARRKITKVFHRPHFIEYVLDKMVCIASGYYLGIDTYDDDSRLCVESDFIRIGQSISNFNNQVLTLEMIE